MASIQARPCRDCLHISADSRYDRPEPHEYMVLRRPGPSAVYQCLVCHTNLVFEHRAQDPHWESLPRAEKVAQPA
jgi:hypothetical protein